MKKTLIALAALAATGAFAQNVTVYGRLDAGYAMTTNTVNGADTKANGVQSHNSVSSMWGLKGTEDLGGGMNAFFVLEQDIYPANGNTGTTGSAGGAQSATAGGATGFASFDRTSLVGVKGGFGSIAFGRDYVPTFKLIGGTDVNNLSRMSTVNLSNNTGVSTDPNIIFYSTPNMGGFMLNVAYRNQDQSTATDTYQKLTNVTAVYANGPLLVGVGTGTTESRAAGLSSTGMSLSAYGLAAVANADKIAGNVLAASYDFGKAKLSANYITTKISGGTFDGNEVKELNIGATMPLGKVTLQAQVGKNTATISGTDYTGTDIVIGADYALSARTALFAKTGTYAKLDGAGATGGDNKSVSTAIGIKTTF